MVTEREYQFARIVLMVYGASISNETIPTSLWHEAAKQIFSARRVVKEYEDEQH